MSGVSTWEVLVYDGRLCRDFAAASDPGVELSDLTSHVAATSISSERDAKVPLRGKMGTR